VSPSWSDEVPPPSAQPCKDRICFLSQSTTTSPYG